MTSISTTYRQSVVFLRCSGHECVVIWRTTLRSALQTVRRSSRGIIGSLRTFRATDICAMSTCLSTHIHYWPTSFLESGVEAFRNLSTTANYRDTGFNWTRQRAAPIVRYLFSLQFQQMCEITLKDDTIFVSGSRTAAIFWRQLVVQSEKFWRCVTSQSACRKTSRDV